LLYSKRVAKDAITLLKAYLNKLPNFKKIIVFGYFAWPILAKDKFSKKDKLIIKTNLYVFIKMHSNAIYKLYNILLYKVEIYINIKCSKYLYL
jgi:hypothetical protein